MRPITPLLDSLTTTRRRLLLGLSLVLVVVLGALALGTTADPQADVTSGDLGSTASDDDSYRPAPTATAPSSTVPTTEPSDPTAPTAPGAPADPAEHDPSTAATGRGSGPFEIHPHDATAPLVPGTPTTVELAHDPASAGITDYQSLGVPSPTSSPYNGGFGYSAGPGCATSCITSGVAHVSGPGAELTVTTSVPARIWIVVWTDEHTFTDDSGSLTTSFSHDFDELFADRTYSAMAVAEDADGYTDHRYGSFETMARMAKITLDTGLVHSVPNGTLEGSYDIDVWLNGQLLPDAWDHGIAAFDLHETVDLRIRVTAHHPHGQCIGQPPMGGPVPNAASGGGNCHTWIVLSTWNGDGSVDPVSVLSDPAVVETDDHRRVETTLRRAPGVDSDLDATVGMAVEVVYV